MSYANGPLGEQTDVRLRGISVYSVSPEEALQLASDDPMVRARRLAVEVVQWSTAEGAARFGHR